MASRSPLREGMETDSYYMMFDSSDEEEEGAIAEPQEITNGIYRQQDLFQAAQRKPGEETVIHGQRGGCPPENWGGIYPVWGYPRVLPENWPNWSSCEDMFWAWVETLKYSPTELQELREDRLLSKILDQRDLRFGFVHLVSKRQLPTGIQKCAASSAPDELGYGVSSTSVPRSGKKPRTTYEAATAFVPTSRQPSDSLPGAVQSAPMSSRSGHNPSTSQEAGAYREAAAPGVSAPRVSGPLRIGQGGAEGPEVDRLRQRVLVLEIALGLGAGGDTAALAGNQGVLARLAERLDQLQHEVSDLHGWVDRRAFSSDLDEAFRMIRRVEGCNHVRRRRGWTKVGLRVSNPRRTMVPLETSNIKRRCVVIDFGKSMVAASVKQYVSSE
ncbi:hypothetical protein L915_07652 [Phytophthora nicotianae]|uniref:Uncharacterized protein n=1 Tax=Phytophthora nicotianae TaxID=4792 RepID=W2H0E9_PHYNI|nr:hypothetical protein L915_07652 [Phytophthora nicotianae]